MIFGLCLLILCALPVFAKDTLDIYWIDVEGGAATLIVTPDSETILMDAGWPGFEKRDPKRIVHVLEEEVGVTGLDYFITSHFHRDHVGGLAALASLVPIGKFVDHGDSVEIGWNERADDLWKSYVEATGGKRIQIKPGDTLPLANMEFLFVAARSNFIDPLQPDVAPNPHCRDSVQKQVDRGENGKSVGILVRFGKFDFLDLGDLSWNYEIETACPVNLFGEIDLYQVTHHGMHMSGAPAHLHAIRPKVAVMNNGPRKGGRPETFEVLTSLSSLETLWQVHRSLATDAAHNPSEDFIANLGETEECDGNWIKATIWPDGRFTIFNSRNEHSMEYKAD